MFNIYRKCTAAVIIIPNDSFNPLEHKLAAIRYLPNNLSSYPMKETKKKENDAIKQILYNTRYGTAILNKVKGTNM
jgi:hypothetical protein